MKTEEINIVATDLANKMDGLSHDEAVQIIGTALKAAWRAATALEHDRIEKILGTRPYQEVRAMIQRCKVKWGHLKGRTNT